MPTQVRPRPPVMSVTDTAAEKLREIVGRFDPPLAGLRVGVKNAGCAGMAYTLDPVHTPNPADDTVTVDGLKVFVDAKAVLFLLGSVMDHRTTKFSSGFVFDNPNQVSECGCGESVKLEPAKQQPEAAH
jgi:iron-sulfur cluster assembly protein